MLAKQLLNPSHHDDKSLLFSGGLQWLIDSATELERAKERDSRRISLLTEDAVQTLSRTKDGKRKLIKAIDKNNGEIESDLGDCERVEDWVSQQTGASRPPY